MRDRGRELRSALHAVAASARLCARVRERATQESTVVTKSDGSPVTIADVGSQVIIASYLAESWPTDAIIGEEDRETLEERSLIREAVLACVQMVRPELTEPRMMRLLDRHDAGDHPSRFWTLDPIDGTKGFLRGDQYAIALALVEDAEPVLGVLGCPALPASFSDPLGPTGWLLYAIEGGGAWSASLDGTSFQPLDTDVPAPLRICESVEKEHSAHGVHAAIMQRLGISEPPLRIDSQCKYAVVARGDAALYLRIPRMATYCERIWDHAAGACILAEAGGTVTDCSGRTLRFVPPHLAPGAGVVATRGIDHEAVIDAVMETLKISPPHPHGSSPGPSGT